MKNSQRGKNKTFSQLQAAGSRALLGTEGPWNSRVAGAGATLPGAPGPRRPVPASFAPAPVGSGHRERSAGFGGGMPQTLGREQAVETASAGGETRSNLTSRTTGHDLPRSLAH